MLSQRESATNSDRETNSTIPYSDEKDRQSYYNRMTYFFEGNSLRSGRHYALKELTFDLYDFGVNLINKGLAYHPAIAGWNMNILFSYSNANSYDQVRKEALLKIYNELNEIKNDSHSQNHLHGMFIIKVALDHLPMARIQALQKYLDSFSKETTLTPQTQIRLPNGTHFYSDHAIIGIINFYLSSCEPQLHEKTNILNQVYLNMGTGLSHDDFNKAHDLFNFSLKNLDLAYSSLPFVNEARLTSVEDQAISRMDDEEKNIKKPVEQIVPASTPRSVSLPHIHTTNTRYHQANINELDEEQQTFVFQIINSFFRTIEKNGSGAALFVQFQSILEHSLNPQLPENSQLFKDHKNFTLWQDIFSTAAFFFIRCNMIFKEIAEIDSRADSLVMKFKRVAAGMNDRLNLSMNDTKVENDKYTKKHVAAIDEMFVSEITVDEEKKHVSPETKKIL